MKSERGIAHILILLAAVGLISYILISYTTSFKDGLFSKLYPKPSSFAAEEKLFGVNITGAEFGDSNLPGSLNTDYIYPSTYNGYQSNSYFKSKGQTLVRIPFRWERVQNQFYGSLTSTDILEIRKMLDNASAQNQKVILDMHNYGRYINGSETVLTRADADKLADVWKKLASEFQAHPAVWGYEIMNEPHDLPEGDDSWLDIAQVTVNAIRAVDQSHYILIPGSSWQSADRWPQVSDNLKNIQDPADSTLSKIIFAAHQYFDADSSGGADHPCVSDQIGVLRVNNFLSWLDNNSTLTGKSLKGIITEYGARADGVCPAALENFLTRINSHSRIVGGTYWAAGPWWGNYGYSVEPENGQDKPQMNILQKFISRTISVPVIDSSTTPSPTPTPITNNLLEGENMNLPANNGQIFDDWNASQGKALLIWSNGFATGSANSDGNQITVTAKGDQCSGAPHMQIYVDGTMVKDYYVANSNYQDFNAPITNSGYHTININYDNDLTVPQSCDRNLRIDKVSISSSTVNATANPTPVPTLSPTPTPTPIVNHNNNSRKKNPIK
jgi:endoglucanase